MSAARSFFRIFASVSKTISQMIHNFYRFLKRFTISQMIYNYSIDLQFLKRFTISQTICNFPNDLRNIKYSARFFSLGQPPPPPASFCIARHAPQLGVKTKTCASLPPTARAPAPSRPSVCSTRLHGCCRPCCPPHATALARTEWRRGSTGFGLYSFTSHKRRNT